MPPTTTTTSSQSLLLLPILAILIGLSQAYPAFFMQAIPRGGGRHLQLSHHHANSPIHLAAPHKRAFDRLDVSPFDFDAMTKRFNDDELSALPFDDNMYTVSLQVPQRKRAFDRLEDSGFFGLHKRAFDRLDNSFMMLKRNAE